MGQRDTVLLEILMGKTRLSLPDYCEFKPAIPIPSCNIFAAAPYRSGDNDITMAKPK